jgi:hypothetical protein
VLVDEHAHGILLFSWLFITQFLDLLLRDLRLFGDSILDCKFKLFRFFLGAQLTLDFSFLVYYLSTLVRLLVVVLYAIVCCLWRHTRGVIEPRWLKQREQRQLLHFDIVF